MSKAEENQIPNRLYDHRYLINKENTAFFKHLIKLRKQTLKNMIMRYKEDRLN